MALRKAIESNLDKQNAYSRLGYVYEELEKFSEAIEAFEKAAEINPNDYHIYGMMGWINYRLGDYEKSITTSRQALFIKKDELWIHFNLGLALIQTGAIEEALTEYDTVINLASSAEELESGPISAIKKQIAQFPKMAIMKEILEKLESAKAKYQDKKEDDQEKRIDK